MAEAVEEEEVAGAKPRATNGTADLELGLGTVRQLDAETPVHPARQSGAVEAAGPRTSPDVRRADLAKSESVRRALRPEPPSCGNVEVDAWF